MFVVLNDPNLPEFDVYLEARIGGKSGLELLSELSKGSFFVSREATKDILASKNLLSVGESNLVKFARLRVRELGFKAIPPQVSEVWTRIESLGLGLCNVLDVLVLRSKIVQPIGDRVLVATGQQVRFARIYHIFTLGQYHDSAPCLNRELINPRHKLGLDTEIIVRVSESS